MIAIPDFSAGAMVIINSTFIFFIKIQFDFAISFCLPSQENWGLITYRETALLFQPNISTSTSQNHVASVIAHELAVRKILFSSIAILIDK